MSGQDRRIQIRIPSDRRDIDEKIWKDLEEYLFTGFLSCPAKIFENTFVFKTLNHQEIRNICYLYRDHEGVFKSAFIASSLFMAVGKNVLHGRADSFDKLISVISKIPSVYQDKIIQNLNFLNKRASRLYPLVEVYVHEARSRYRWLFLKKLPIHSLEATGIHGTSQLGMNYCQQSWVALNEVLDRKEDNEVAWNHAKFIGSCFAGKGIISIDEQDKARRNNEINDIEEKKTKVLSEYLDGTGESSPVVKTVPLPDGRQATIEGRFKAETAEELADQLSAALSGEKDWHDRTVENHFRKSMLEQEALSRQSRALAAAPHKFIESIGQKTGGGGSTVVNERDAKEYLRRMQALMIRSDPEEKDDVVLPPDINPADRQR